MSSKPAGNGWSLEVVRGKDAGRIYALDGGEIVLGNGLGGAAGIDLADQEGTSPKRMAARQAKLECTGAAVTIRDLDSPGGTFVNRQRVLSGQGRALQEGDLIQLGGVQLKVVRPSAPPAPAPAPAPPPPPPRAAPEAPPRPSRVPASAPAPPPPPPRSSAPAPAPRPAASATFAFVLKAGPTCRTPDDFLAVSAQKWADLREELTSGRLAAYFASIGRSDLAPSPTAPGTPDERLDAWIAALPTTRPSLPELDVHPRKLVVRAAPGGGTTRRTVQVANTGHRLLRSTVRVEPPGTPWLSVPPEFSGRPIVTIDQTEVHFIVTIPEVYAGPLSAALVVESNGGTQRVDVALEPPAAREEIPEAGPIAPARVEWGLRDRIARQSIPSRLFGWGTIGFIFRCLIGVGSSPSSGLWLPAPALEMAFSFGVLGVIWALRRGETADAPAVGFAAAFAGVLAAAVGVAVCRTIEPLFGPLAGSWIGVATLWVLIGVAAAGVSLWFIPAVPRSEASP